MDIRGKRTMARLSGLERSLHLRSVGVSIMIVGLPELFAPLAGKEWGASARRYPYWHGAWRLYVSQKVITCNKGSSLPADGDGGGVNAKASKVHPDSNCPPRPGSQMLSNASTTAMAVPKQNRNLRQGIRCEEKFATAVHSANGLAPNSCGLFNPIELVVKIGLVVAGAVAVIQIMDEATTIVCHSCGNNCEPTITDR